MILAVFTAAAGLGTLIFGAVSLYRTPVSQKKQRAAAAQYIRTGLVLLLLAASTLLRSGCLLEVPEPVLMVP